MRVLRRSATGPATKASPVRPARPVPATTPISASPAAGSPPRAEPPPGPEISGSPRPPRPAVPRPPRALAAAWPPWTPRALFLPLGCALLGIALLASLGALAGGPAREAAVPRPPVRAVHPAPAHPASVYTAPRPRIVPRTVWMDDTARHVQPPPRYDDKVVAVFIHHTDSPNGYDCADSPRIIRYLYAGQTGVRSWDDIGYNFLVDRCGTIYEGRAGGVDRAVTGAHTQGFNHRTAGIAALGTFTEGMPVPKAMTDAIAALAAWKLGLAGIDPRSLADLVSSNSLSRYKKGEAARLPALAGHQDGYMTSCPGAALSARLPAIRDLAARLQGRPGTGLTATP
jgi:hypothetical protein